MIKYYKKTAKDKDIKKLKGYDKDCWINVVNPTESQIAYLISRYGLEKENLTSGLDIYEVPRLDRDKNNNLYVFVNSPSPIMQTFLIAIGKNFILTLAQEQTGFVDDIIEGRLEVRTDRKKKMMLLMIKEVAKSHERVSLQLAKEVSRRKKDTKQLRDKDLMDLLENEDVLNEYVTSYYHMATVCEKIMDKVRLKQDNKEILKDLIVENKQGYNTCRSSLKTIQNIRSYYDSILTNKLNRTIKILTVFTIFLAIPATVGGLMGMNLILPFQRHTYAFGYVLAFIVFLWSIFYIYLRRKQVL